MPKSTCCIHECEKPLFGHFLCNKHYLRLRKTGTTDLRPMKPKQCRMPNCSAKSRKLGWCAKHHSRIERTGSPFDKDQSWVIAAEWRCIVCGSEVLKGGGLRRYCSTKCIGQFHTQRTATSKPCAGCGEFIDLTARHESGRLKYSNASRCDSCKQSVNLRRFVPILFSRDGEACGLCRESIDMALKYPDPASRSVDHILPRSHGGDEALSNLRLTHLSCNVRRQDRMEVSSMT